MALPGYWMVSVTTMMPCLPESACLGNNTCAESYLGTFCSHCAASHFRLDLKCYACSENHATRLILSVLGYICGALLMFCLTAYEMRLASVNILVDFVQVLALCTTMRLQWDAAERPLTPSILESATLLNFNFDQAEPECSLPGWSYESKWWYTETLPFFFLFTLWVASHAVHCLFTPKATPRRRVEPHVVDSLLSHGSFYDGQRGGGERGDGDEEQGLMGKSRNMQNDKVGVRRASSLVRVNVKKRRKSRRSKARRTSNTKRVGTHKGWRRGITPHAWGAASLLMYYMFFGVILRAWEPWDCTTHTLGDNFTASTMDADPTERCYGSDGSTYWTRTALFSVIAGSFYTFAFPAYMGSIFFRYRKEIRKDLSVSSEGKAWRRDLAAIRIQSHVRGHNHRKVFKTGHYYSRNARVHNTVMVRKHYGKLYEDFRPGKFWWRLVLMSRKALLAFTIFVPASAPVFQASMVLMILFVSFVLQVNIAHMLRGRPCLAIPILRATTPGIARDKVVGS